MKIVKILNTPCLVVENITDFKSYFVELINKKINGYSVAINAEKIMYYGKDKEVQHIIDNCLLPSPDGSGAQLGIKFKYGYSTIKVDLPRTTLEVCNENKLKLFILGAKKNINEKAKEEIKKEYPNINIVGNIDGYFESEEEVINTLINLQPQVTLIALGSPKQEKFSAKAIKNGVETIFIGSGGALDIIAKTKKRAPIFYQKNHLEWFYRLINEPSRIKRQIKLPVFFIKIILESLKYRIINK